jgi:PAS domain S-box-containing protein
VTDAEIGDVQLAQMIDAPAVQALMDDFYAVSKIPMAVIDLQGKVLVGVGWQDICTKFHRVNPESSRNCIESDIELTAGVPAGEHRLYRCKNSMWDIATPIMIGGRHVGNIFSGQFFFDDESLDYDLFRAQAHRYGFDEEAYLAALDRVPRLSRECVRRAMGFLTKLGHMLSVLGYSNINLARSLAERDTLTASLHATADRLRKSQQIAHLGSWELDLVGGTLTWSDEVYRIFGLEPQQFGATYEAFLEAVHPDDRAAVDAAYSGSVREGMDRYEISHRVVRKNTGEVRWVEERCEHVRDGAGRIIRSIGMVQDITDRVKAERAVHEAQKFESIGVLAGGVAHDFNNLLTSILGNASLIELQWGPSSKLAAIIQASEKAAGLTQQLLAYAGKGQVQISDFDVAQLVEASADILRVSIPKTVSLAVELPEDAPPVRGDASQIHQVIMNLVINAAESINGGDGAVAVSVSVRELDWESARRATPALTPGRYVAVAVRDNGCGMDEETRSKIFDPFFTTKFTGRGLGLAAVQGILRSHKGGIEVESSHGRGSTFTVFLPCRIRKTSKEGACSPGARTRGATVLVVDDEEYVRSVAKAALEGAGHTVLLACDGRQALQALAQDPGVDLVLLDIVMPGGSGRETFSKICERWPHVAVLVVSAYSRDEAQRLGIPGKLPFLPKPFTAQKLVATVNATLDAHAGAF